MASETPDIVQRIDGHVDVKNRFRWEWLSSKDVHDVDDIKLVVNYDYPNTVDDYIHRIGRTARASKKGTAITFVSDEDAGKLNDLIKVLKDSGQPIPQELSDLARLHSKLGKKAPNRNKFGSPRRNYQSWNNGGFERRKSW